VPGAADQLLDPALRVAFAYLLGSVNGSLVIGRLAGGVDIRTQGSGNAGGTNALRTQGRLFALGVVAIDIGKGWIAAGWLPRGAGGWVTVACAFAAIVGHVLPVWHGFRGGKGAATLLGALAGVDPLLLLPAIAIWLAVAIAAGYVGLATMTAAAVLPLAVWALGAEPFAPLMTFALACAALVVFTHRGNLRRMRAGTEPRARRLWRLGRGSGQARR
jgi:glycerol-3-phosphate acyltransferase PlsY